MEPSKVAEWAELLFGRWNILPEVLPNFCHLPVIKSLATKRDMIVIIPVEQKLEDKLCTDNWIRRAPNDQQTSPSKPSKKKPSHPKNEKSQTSLHPKALSAKRPCAEPPSPAARPHCLTLFVSWKKDLVTDSKPLWMRDLPLAKAEN